MNAPMKPAACEPHEHEIADLVDGLLNETDAYRLRAHLANCAGCRAWHADYSATDELLAAALPKPSLSAGFDAALHSRLRTLQAVNGRDARRAAADAEHDALIADLRLFIGRNAFFGAIAGAFTGCALTFLLQWVLRHESVVRSAFQGTGMALVYGGVGATIAVAVIGWVLSRSAIVTPRLARW
jgi:anti-sigma factor RsiW